MEEDDLRERLLREDASAPRPDVEALFRAVERDLERERGVVAWIRSRPTWILRALTALAALPVAVYMYCRYGLRPDGADYPGLKMAAVALGFVAAPVWLLALASRPLHRPQPSRRARVLWSVAGLAAAFLVATYGIPQRAPLCFADEYLSGILCYLWCLYLGTPVLAAGVLFCRHATLGRALLAGAAAGLVSNVEMELHCSTTDREHLLLSHAPAGLTFVVAILVASALVRAVQRSETGRPRLPGEADRGVGLGGS